MEKAEILEKRYGEFIDQTSNSTFFSCLNDYIDFITKTQEMRVIVDDIMKEKGNLYDELDSFENTALAEIKTSKEQLLRIIKDNKIDPNSFSFSSVPKRSENLLEQMEMHEKGKMIEGKFLSDTLESFLFDIAVNISKLGYKKAVEKFIVSEYEYTKHWNGNISGNVNGNFVFTKTISLRRKKEEDIENARAYSLWGALDSLLKLNQAFSGKSLGLTKNELIQKHINPKNLRNYAEISDAWDIIDIFEDLELIEGNVGMLVLSEEDIKRELRYLKISDFKKFTKRIHSQILEKLEKNKIENLTKQKNELNTKFEVKSDSLKYNGKELKIIKPQNTRYYFLLKALLENPKKMWEYDEIWEKLNGDENYDPKNWKKIYNPAYDINEKIAKETTISDFLEITKTTIRINPTYLK